MGFCPKCGTRLEEGDLFCPTCGNKIENRETKTNSEDIFEKRESESNIIPLSGSHPLTKVGFWLSAFALLLFISALAITFSYYERDLPRGTASLIGFITIMSFLIGAAGIGTTIPGFILTKKRKGPMGLSIAALVLSCILGFIFFLLLIVSGTN